MFYNLGPWCLESRAGLGILRLFSELDPSAKAHTVLILGELEFTGRAFSCKFGEGRRPRPRFGGKSYTVLSKVEAKLHLDKGPFWGKQHHLKKF